MIPLLLIFFCIGSINGDTALFSSETRNASLNDLNASYSLLKTFWETNIHSFKLEHATSSFYYSHFKQNGINAFYPEILIRFISKTRKIWTDHEQDVMKKSYLFHNFEKRLDASLKSGSISLFFSAQPVVTREFSSGYSKGGEWIKEIKYFLDEASKHPSQFSNQEWETIQEAKAFADSVLRAPSMIIAVHADHPSLKGILGSDSLFVSFNVFIEYVKIHYPSWENPIMLSNYLQTTLLPLIAEEKKKITSQYEFVLSEPIPPESLEFIFSIET